MFLAPCDGSCFVCAPYGFDDEACHCGEMHLLGKMHAVAKE